MTQSRGKREIITSGGSLLASVLSSKFSPYLFDQN